MELPDLGRTDVWVLLHGIHPEGLDCFAFFDVPEQRLDRAFDLLVLAVSFGLTRPRHLDESQRPREGLRWERRDRGQLEELRRGRVVVSDARHDSELHDLARGVGVGGLELDSRVASAEGLVGSEVPEEVAPHGYVREIDDHVGPLGQTHEQPVVVIRGDVHGRGQEPTLVSDLPRLDPGNVAEVEDEET